MQKCEWIELACDEAAQDKYRGNTHGTEFTQSLLMLSLLRYL